MKEFETVFSEKLELKTLEAVFHKVETKYRLIKKQQEVILDKLVEEGVSTDEESMSIYRKLGDSQG